VRSLVGRDASHPCVLDAEFLAQQGALLFLLVGGGSNGFLGPRANECVLGEGNDAHDGCFDGALPLLGQT
jgi:hypothetical protein